ncbi:glycoside hydrolase family 95-like protein [Propionibacterium freudenreichii]|uniref:glycoside hydrolase family 95-like protein n=1 Tax=Propionibacterium freudenreichii TaxID=1744 RepID=UPI0031BA18FD
MALLPTLPARWPDGRVAGVRVPGDHSIALSWRGGALREATVAARRDDVLALDLPRGEFTVRDAAGAAVDATRVGGSDPGRMLVSFPASRGQTYTVSAL